MRKPAPRDAASRVSRLYQSLIRKLRRPIFHPSARVVVAVDDAEIDGGLVHRRPSHGKGRNPIDFGFACVCVECACGDIQRGDVDIDET